MRSFLIAATAIATFAAALTVETPDANALVRRAVRRATTRRVTAAGGITTQEEIDKLQAMGIDAVVGMAIYTGTLKLDW